MFNILNISSTVLIRVLFPACLHGWRVFLYCKLYRRKVWLKSSLYYILEITIFSYVQLGALVKARGNRESGANPERSRHCKRGVLSH